MRLRNSENRNRRGWKDGRLFQAAVVFFQVEMSESRDHGSHGPCASHGRAKTGCQP